MNIDELKLDDKGLIPAIVADCETGDVLTLAYMNKESLEITINEKRTCFWSRSRNELWRKGETSGNVQHLVSITADCDKDALLISVSKEGPACHTGTESCFNQPLWKSDEMTGFSLQGLYDMLKDRKANPVEGSYTSYLFEEGVDKILKKVGEESTEVIIAGKAGDNKEAVYEIADLYYHVLTLMVEMGITPDEVKKELASRHIVDKKVKQEKMTDGTQ